MGTRRVAGIVVGSVMGLLLAVMVAACAPSEDRLDTRAVAPAERSTASASTPELRVHVEWSDGTPASDVRVNVRRQAEEGRPVVPIGGTTDPAGAVAFAIDEPGVFAVTLDRPETVTLPSQWIDLRDGKTAGVTMAIPDGIDVEGQVCDARAVPISGATISVNSLRERGAYEVCQTDADGRFALRALASPQSLLVQHPEYQASAIYELRTDEHLTVELQDGPRSLRGVVRDERGAPISKAVVELTWHNRFTRGESPHLKDCLQIVHADDEGRYELGQLHSSTVTVSAKVPHLAPTSVTTVLGDAGVHELDITVTPAWVVSGVVTDATGAPVEGAWIDRETGGREKSAYAVSDAQGRYTLAPLPVRWPLLDGRLRVIHADMVPLSSVDDFPLLDAIEWNPVLQGGIELYGQVTGLDPGRSGRVRAEAWKDEAIIRSESLVGGHFRFRGLDEGEYTVTVGPTDDGFFASKAGVTGGEELLLHAEKLLVTRLRGTIVSELGHRPEVTITREGEVMELNPGRTGVFDEEVRPGAYHVDVVESDGAETRRDSYVVDVAAGSTVDLGPIQLFKRYGELAVDATFEDGVGERDVDLRVRRPSSHRRSSHFERRDEGELVAGKLLGEYVLSVRGRGIASAEYDVNVLKDDTTSVEITIRKGYEFALEVGTGDGGGDRASALDVIVRDDTGTGVYIDRLPFMRGSRSLTLWLAPGRYEVGVANQVGGRATEAVEITEVGASLAVHIP